MFLSLIPLMCWVIIRCVSWQVYGILGLVSASQTQISLCHNLLLGCQIILRFCTEHDSITVVLGQLFTMIECACSVAVCERMFHVSRAPQNIRAKIHNTRNHIYGENLYMCRLWAHVQSFTLKFPSQILFVQYTNSERIFGELTKR